MLHPALLHLIRLRWRGLGRRMTRGLKSVRGAVFFGLGILMFGMWLGPSLVMGMLGGNADLEQLRATIPVFILGTCLISIVSSAGDRAIYFSPGEVDFLFAGPFSRRELLVYRLVLTLIGIAFSSVIFSTVFLRFAASWIAAYVGVFLSLLFVQLFTMAAMLIGHSMAERAYTRARKIVIGLVGAVLALAIGQGIAARTTGGFGEIMVAVRQTPVLRELMYIFEPFARTLAAPALFPDMALWAAAGLAVNLALFAFILRLDAEYREAAIVISQKVYSRMQRAQRGGMSAITSTSARRRVPRLPFLGGAGPIAWRQLTNAIRNARGLFMLLVFVGISIGIPFMSRSGSSEHLWPVSISMLVWLSIFMTMIIRFDFRMDIEVMDWLKMLPLRPATIVIGQLAVPVALASLLQILVVAFTVVKAGRPEMILYVALFAPPVNLMLFGAENTLFLLSPTRLATFSPGDFQVIGKQLLFLLIKFVVFGVALGVAVSAGFIVTLILPGSKLIPAIVAWVLIVGQSVVFIPAASWTFRRFDISLDMPA